MKNNYVVAYDLGTSGVKAGIVDFEGNLCGTELETYPLYTPHESWAEQEPEDYWRAVCASTQKVLTKTGISAENVKGIAFCTQWKGIIPLDKDDKVLHRSILWLDGRADKQAQNMNKILKFNYYKEKYFGFKPSSKLNVALGKDVLCGADYWPKLAWVREELPEIYDETDCILECNSYVKWRATGVKAADMTNHFTKSFRKSSQSLYELLLKLGKVSPDLFPDIVMPTDQVGTVTETAAAEMGLCAGTPVFGGCGDIPAISIGGASSDLGDTHIYFGSSGWLASMVSSKEGFLSTSPFDKDNDLLMFGFQAIGLSFDWTVRQLYHKEQQELGSDIFPLLQDELKDIPAGSEGLLASHWMYGERPPFFNDDARGVFVNLGSRHDRRHMLNAVMESVCYSFKMSLDGLENGTKRRIPKINAVGGGTLNDHWMQMLADVLGIPVHVPENTRHSGSIGTAYCALIGLGVYKDLNEVKKKIKMEKVYAPNPDNKAVYEKMCGEYSKLYGKTRSIFRALK